MKRNQKNKEKANGEGTIYTSTKTGLLVGQYVVNGKRKSVYQKKNEKKIEFKKRFNDILSSINTGTYIENSTISLEKILEKYIEQKHKDGRTIARSYKRELETLQLLKKCCNNFMNKPIQKVNADDINEAKPEIRKYSSSVIDKMWSMLKLGFRIAHSRRKILFNIMEDETLIKPISQKDTQPLEALTTIEENKLISILDNEERNHKYRNIVKVQLISGMRIGEVLARTKDDFDIKSKTLLVKNTLTQDKDYNIIISNHTKTYNKHTKIDTGKRTLQLTGKLSELNDILIEELNKKLTNMHGLIFWNYDKNTFITPSEINSWLKRINKKYNITNKRFSSHVLRHTRITRWREDNMDMQVIQYLVGHVDGSPLTTQVYTTIFKDFVLKELIK